MLYAIVTINEKRFAIAYDAITGQCLTDTGDSLTREQYDSILAHVESALIFHHDLNAMVLWHRDGFRVTEVGTVEFTFDSPRLAAPASVELIESVQ